MPVAEIIAIGTELLLGEIQDTNTRYLARILRDNGIDLYRTMMIGDNAQRIADAINESLNRAQIVITTGGLGPTVDDPTRDAVALAFGVQTEYVPELWDQIQSRFMRFNRTPTENNRRQAYIPAGGFAVENPVGTAPAFIMERGDSCVFCLPGVPKEMEYLIENAVMPYLRTRYHLTGLIKAKVLHTIGLGESAVDDLIGDLELLKNPTVGLLAHSGQVDVRITAKAESEADADEMIAECERVLVERLGMAIYGADGDTIEGVVTDLLAVKDLQAVCIVSGLDGSAIDARIRATGSDHLRVVEAAMHPESLLKTNSLVVWVTLEPAGEKQNIDVDLEFQNEHHHLNRSFGGPPALASVWAVNAMFAALHDVLVRLE